MESCAVSESGITRRGAIALAGAAVLLATASLKHAGATQTQVTTNPSARPLLTDLPIVEFGSYPQTSDGDSLPIEWHVLAEEDGRQLLLSRYALDCRAYNSKFQGVTWQSCDLRFWLNGEFARAAFTEEEQAHIALVELDNPGNERHDIDGGGVTRDHVFCLSLNEIRRYLGADAYDHDHVGTAYPDLVAPPTDYAKSNRINCPADGGAVWWLRSPGDDASEAAYVYHDGSVDAFGDGVDYPYYGIRPAIWLDAVASDGDGSAGTLPDAFESDALSCTDGGIALEARVLGLGKPHVELAYEVAGSYRGALVHDTALTVWARDGLGYFCEEKLVELGFDAEPLAYGQAQSGSVDLEFSQAVFSLECQRATSSMDRGLSGLDLVEFGSYPQTGDGDSLPIEWRVIAERDGARLLLAEQVLDCVTYNEQNADVTWESCTLRAWLNGAFYERAFDQAERERIELSELDNPDNADFDVLGGNATSDRVFCLSLAELKEHLGALSSKACGREYACLGASPTEYAAAQGANANTKTGTSRWWLRSPGDRASFASCVSPFGSVRSDGYGVDYERSAVRPALWVKAW